MGGNLDSSQTRWILLLSAGICILLSMIFSATESAFLSLNRLRVRFLKNQKNKRAMRVWRLLNDKERLINTLLVGNNIVNIIISSILAYIAVDLFGSAGIGIATFTATVVLLVFGEITPKTVATHHPEPIAFFFSGFISVLEVMLAPLVFVFTGVSRFVLGAFKIDTKEKKVSFTEEEIKTFIDVGTEQGVIRKNEKTMMHRVFKFTDLAAHDIMTPRKDIKAIPVTASYEDVISLSEKYRISRFPVYKDDIDDIVGILYIKDLLFYKSDSSNFSLQKVMRPPLFILETKKMSGIQQMLEENHQSMAVVIDEYSGTDGVLTSEDIAREIFGPIADEYKPYARHVEVVIRNKDHSEIEGQARLVDLNEQLGTSLESEYCETIGGLISEVLEHIPAVGESIEKDGYIFSVVKMDDKRVAKVHIQKLNSEEADE
ncbi:MAG TPA: HlyC/CorC family transporter [Treponema sp.]|nr:HlyC/CorC family transporter [Treponema sp.]HCA20604.1 HlyC/CorC family transporter [Treponema sp.]